MRRTVVILILFYLGSLYSASHHPQDFLKRIRGKPHEGRQIVQHYCANCHAKNPIIPVGAPRIGVTEDWTIRLKKGMNALFKHTDEGLNAMPARGGCFECSDEQLKLAIEYMLSKKEKM